jgi:hypothetical protein
MKFENLNLDYPAFKNFQKRYHYLTTTLPPEPTVRDWFKEQLWADDPDPREDLIHPFVD